MDLGALILVSMGKHNNEYCTLVRQMSQLEISTRSRMDSFTNENAWWVTLENPTYTAEYYVPERCLLLTGDRKPLERPSTLDAPSNYKTTNKKEQTDMYLYIVTVIKTPSTLAQQAGEIDSIIVEPTAVMAKDQNAAILKAGAENAEDILKESKSQLRVVITEGK